MHDDVGRGRSEIGARTALRLETLSEGVFGKAGAELRHDAPAMFCAMLGTVAGNLALSLGAQGGVYIGGAGGGGTASAAEGGYSAEASHYRHPSFASIGGKRSVVASK